MNPGRSAGHSIAPDVSVIIPTYNRGPLIAEAIESVLAQTYQNYEIIVVDDGSTDDTLDRLAAYREQVRIVQTQHGGAAHARNAGIKAAKGKYVAFLDSDDRYLPHKLALQVQILDQFADVGMVYSEFSSFGRGTTEEFHLKTYHAGAFRHGETYDRYFDRSWSLKERGLDCPPWSDRRLYVGEIFDHYLRFLFVFTNSALLRHSLLDLVGFQDESFPLFEEYEFFLRVTKRCRIAFVDVPTYQLRYHPGQISTTMRADGPAVFVERQRQLLRVVERHGVQDHQYYLAHKKDVDIAMGKLHRDLGVALLCHPGHEAEARAIFREGRRYGLSAPGFFMLTFLPSLVRRVVMKIREIMQ